MILKALFRPNQHFTQMQTPIRRARGLLYLFLYNQTANNQSQWSRPKIVKCIQGSLALSLKMTDYSTLQLDSSIVFYISFELREKSLEVPPFLCVCCIQGNRHLIASPSLSGIVRTNKPTDGKLSSFVAHIAQLRETTIFKPKINKSK